MTGFSFKVLGAMGLASYAAAYACVKLRHVSYDRFLLIAVPAGKLPEMPKGYSHRMLGPEELARFTIDIGPEIQAERFAAGMECLAIFDRRGELAGVSWLAKRAYREGHLQVRFQLPDNAAWDTGLWVPEDKRMGRAFAATWAAIRHWLQREELDWTLSSIADYNIPSILSHRRLGARTLGHVVVVRIGRWQFTIGARPFVTVQGRDAMPTARLKVA